MFEALRGLRDAVAPESGNLGGNAANESSEPDMEDQWHAYKNGDPEITAKIKKVNAGVAPQKREDFIRLHAKMEMEKDVELVMKLAGTVLEKSSQIDAQVDALPGMQRTRAEQMKLIEELLEANQKASQDLEAVYATAKERRDSCRTYIRENACQALGIEEEEEAD